MYEVSEFTYDHWLILPIIADSILCTYHYFQYISGQFNFILNRNYILPVSRRWRNATVILKSQSSISWFSDMCNNNMLTYVMFIFSTIAEDQTCSQNCVLPILNRMLSCRPKCKNRWWKRGWERAWDITGPRILWITAFAGVSSEQTWSRYWRNVMYHCMIWSCNNPSYPRKSSGGHLAILSLPNLFYPMKHSTTLL